MNCGYNQDFLISKNNTIYYLIGKTASGLICGFFCIKKTPYFIGCFTIMKKNDFYKNSPCWVISNPNSSLSSLTRRGVILLTIKNKA